MFPLGLGFSAHNTTEAEVTSRSIDWLRHARCWSVGPAVVRRAQVCPPLHHLARDLDLGHTWVVTLLAVSAFGIEACAAGMGNLAVLLVPVRGPLPYITRHIVQPV